MEQRSWELHLAHKRPRAVTIRPPDDECLISGALATGRLFLVRFRPQERKEGGTRFHPLCLPSPNSPGLVYYRAGPEGTHKLWQRRDACTTGNRGLIRISHRRETARKRGLQRRGRDGSVAGT